MAKNNCPFCGSENTELKSSKKVSSLPDGTRFDYVSESISCADCGTITDVGGKDDKAFLEAYEVAKKQSLESICKDLSERGLSMAYIERALQLPQRTIARWKSQGCSSSGMTLMAMIRALPWLVEVADNKYDPAFTAREVIVQAGKLFISTAASHDYSPCVEVFSSHKVVEIHASFQQQKPCEVEQPERMVTNVIPASRQNEFRAEA